MNYFLLFSLHFLLIISQVDSRGTPKSLTCPADPGLIRPCDCKLETPDANPSLSCKGLSIIHEDIEKLFTQLRSTNELPEDGILNIRQLEISNTELTFLKLATFSHSKFIELVITDNPNLFSIFPPTDSENEADIAPLRFGASILIFKNSRIGDASSATLLLYAETSGLSMLDLSGNKIQGNHKELIPRLSKFVDLNRLYLQGNELTLVGGGQFQTFTKIHILALENNKIGSLDKGAFQFDPWGEFVDDRPLEIKLSGNLLDDSKIHGTLGLPATTRQTIINFKNNKFQTLSRLFDSFLQLHPENELHFEDNQFHCDLRLKWIQDAKDDYEKRVSGTTCVNDEGFDAFTSRLVAGEETTTTTSTSSTITTTETPPPWTSSSSTGVPSTSEGGSPSSTTTEKSTTATAFRDKCDILWVFILLIFTTGVV